MRAEVKEDVQVLELSRRALEDQVSKCRHAQVGAALQMGATLSLLCGLSNQVPRTGPHVTPTSSLNQTLRPVLPQLQPAHLILTVLPYHLQGTLGDQRGLQNHLGEDPAQKRGGSCWRRAARQPISLWPTCTPAASALGPELQTGTEADMLLPPDICLL